MSILTSSDAPKAHLAELNFLPEASAEWHALDKGEDVVVYGSAIAHRPRQPPGR